MPNYITIYLNEKLEKLSIDEILVGISAADWWTLAEEFDIEEVDVDDFMNTLKWKTNPMEFYQDGKRPVQISIWNERERMNEEIMEISQKNLPDTVLRHMDAVQSIVILELGISQVRTMFEIVAFEIAYWLAKTRQGLIYAPNGLWYDHNDHRWNPIV